MIQVVVTLLTGAIGGLVGTAVAEGLRRTAADEPSLAATVWAAYLGDGVPAHAATPGLAVSGIYGLLAGVLFVAIGNALGVLAGSTLDVVVGAVAWAGVLLVVAVGFWLRVVMGRRPDREALLALGLAYLGYGVGLGVVVALAES